MTTPSPPIPAMPGGPPKAPEPVRVKILYFDVPRIVPLLDCDGTMKILAAGPGRKDKSMTIQIQYEPWQRHHRVREIDNGKVRSEFCVSEVGLVYVPDQSTGG